MNATTTLEDFESLALACKALSHPARLAILQTLARRGTCICGEIVEVLPLSQATVSQHLKVLKEAGLITGEVDGPRSCYCINNATLQALGAQLGQMFRALEGCC
ncbi:MAG: metalloregulator ArsR/SmtB family transcription factor [Xanthomonadales bacterium]|jgi:ArsR family transcriptional regulator|nr:metalloregulator ArsR/SmtB family transcription factor [Xanthomonadales bacterium]